MDGESGESRLGTSISAEPVSVQIENAQTSQSVKRAVLDLLDHVQAEIQLLDARESSAGRRRRVGGAEAVATQAGDGVAVEVDASQGREVAEPDAGHVDEAVLAEQQGGEVAAAGFVRRRAAWTRSDDRGRRRRRPKHVGRDHRQPILSVSK